MHDNASYEFLCLDDINVQHNIGICCDKLQLHSDDYEDIADIRNNMSELLCTSNIFSEQNATNVRKRNAKRKCDDGNRTNANMAYIVEGGSNSRIRKQKQKSMQWNKK